MKDSDGSQTCTRGGSSVFSLISKGKVPSLDRSADCIAVAFTAFFTHHVSIYSPSPSIIL